ncbi:SLC16A12 [Branchiostoma lanceolatum]|uniref:Monocarboxylate transporter 13 n=1 Tax=Branchiostoma lanceolatum TaxID=7740 RepID=A0A8J9ZTK9_BRALA|nr:SLC16A12 [Branchiostoma lanceolatum]
MTEETPSQMGTLCRRKPGRPVDPPDGGWGWMVALAGFVVSACSYGVMRSLGVFFVTWQDYFSVTAAETGLIQSIITGVLNLAAPIAGALSNRFGCRVVVMAGGVISSAGFLLSLWATSLFHLYLTVGFLTGFGYSLSLITTMATIGRYFTTHRLRANSIAAIGASFVSFAFPPLFQYLMDEYTWRGALVIIGGIVLQVAGFGALERPILLKGDVTTDKTSENVQESSPQSSRFADNKINVNVTTEKHSLTKVILGKISSVIDITLLTEPRFLVFCVAVFLFGFGRFVPNIYIVPRARAFGVEEYPSAFLLSILAIGDIIGRASVGLLPEWPRFRRVDQFAMNTFLMGFITLFAPLAKTYATMAVYSGFYGLLMGGCVPLLYSAIAEIGGANRMSSALGIIMFLRGIGNLAGPPFSGWLRDITGSFDATLLEGGSCLVLAGLLPFVLHLRVFQPTKPENKVEEHEIDGTRLSLLAAEREESSTASTQGHETSVVIKETAL